jgi:DNA-binding MarR family transcriptional regulator
LWDCHDLDAARSSHSVNDLPFAARRFVIGERRQAIGIGRSNLRGGVKRTTRKAASRTAGGAREVDYPALARFRYELRRFLAFSEAAARKEKLTPQQHQALLAIKGFSRAKPVSLGDVAKLLLVRQHTAVELVNRMAKAGLVVRRVDASDRRRIFVSLTAEGERRLRKLSKAHLDELNALGRQLTAMLRNLRSR